MFLTTIPSIFQGVYKETVGIAGLHYIALGIGLCAMGQVNARLIDHLYVYFSKRNGGMGKPEFRLRAYPNHLPVDVYVAYTSLIAAMIPGTILMPIGLLITGWTARPNVHWIGPDIGIVIVGAGMIVNFQTVQTYVIDAFTLHAASGTSCSGHRLLRDPFD